MLKTLTLLAAMLGIQTAIAQAPRIPEAKPLAPMKTASAFAMDKAALKELPAIKKTTLSFQNAWNARDVQGVISHYAPAATMMDHEGNEAMGNEQIQSWLSQSFAGLYKNARSEFEVKNVRVLAPAVALVDIEWSVRNLTGAEGQVLAPQEFHVTVVGQKKANKWLIHDMRTFQFIRPEQLGVGGAGEEPYEFPKEDIMPQP